MIPLRACVCLLCGLAFAAGALRAQGESEGTFPLRLRVVFFPPTPPVIGGRIDGRPEGSPRWLEGRRLAAPDGLAEYVGEYFFPALSTRLFTPWLGRSQEKRVESYRAHRRQLINEILDKFAELQPADQETRLRGLRALAAAQSSAIAALENEAEQLRRDLVGDGLWNNVDWNFYRRWRVGAMTARHDWVEKEGEFQIMRAAAFYADGLLPQQRGLLRELAIEQQGNVRKSLGVPTRRHESDAMFFSPETARLRLPPDLSPAAREKIAAYNREKAILKRELRDAVLAGERESATERTARFSALADQQWPRFATLEQLAEEIRAALWTGLERAPPPPPPWLPAGLVEQIRAYNEDRETFFNEMKQAADEAAESLPRPDLNVSPDERVQRQREHAERQAAARRAAVQAFQERNQTRFLKLRERYDAIRGLLTVVAEKQVDRKTGRPLDADTLLQQHAASMEEFSTYGREVTIYTHYRIAMLEPGLSPEQRRLLFSYVLAGLAQPIPNGEVMPRRSAKQPYPSW